jgi:CVNH domain
MKGINHMRFIRILSLVAIMVALGQTGGSLLAQEANPPGAYQQSCSGISVKKGTLYARCQDDKGKGHSTKLADYEKCGAEIINKNGNLGCANNDGANAESAAPSQPTGSYTETCKDIRMKGNTLHAICKSLDGHEAPTSLHEANRCSQGVINLNGILNCGASDVLPPGSYISTCKDVHMKGTTLYASCNNGKDRWLSVELHEANKCSGDIANQNGALRCAPIRTMERR